MDEQNYRCDPEENSGRFCSKVDVWMLEIMISTERVVTLTLKICVSCLCSDDSEEEHEFWCKLQQSGPNGLKVPKQPG